ncbi:MAG: hypothetical protein J5980_02620 [Muribaculaceae bacterium]|nr:hypothetical protein [Muribaculaceae bacterium]
MNIINSIRKRLYNFGNTIKDEIVSYVAYNSNQLYLRDKTLNYVQPGISETPIFQNKKLIVSLTTYGSRLNEVYLSIESIMNQSLKPNMIILWLSEQFKNTTLPITIQNLQKRGLVIMFCPDIKSYKKLIPTFKLYPNDIIITVDDDVIYNYDLIENLVSSYKLHPNCICANRTRLITTKNGVFEPYSNWKYSNESIISSHLLPIGVGGVLYPPNCFHGDITNEELFLQLCPTADDLWFKAMTILAGYKTYRAPTHEPIFYSNESVQDSSLMKLNVMGGNNDRQIQLLNEHYNLIDCF